MVDEITDDNEASPDLGRAKRAPPTIDLQASEISGETRHVSGDAPPEHPPHEPVAEEITAAGSPPISPWIVAPVSGLVAAALVIGVAWMLGWPAVVAPSAAPAANTAVTDGLAARIARVESKTNTPVASAPDPAAAARIDALEKSMAALRTELASARAQSEKLAAAVNDAKATPGGAAPTPDLSGITERIAQLELASRAQGSEIAQESTRIADSKPADDMPLRRTVAAALLDVMVRIGDPYPAALAAAKSLSDNADALKPLEVFAASGVPSSAVLSRELLTLVPKLSPPSPETVSTQIGYLGLRLAERLGMARAVLLTAVLGAINIPFYEEMAYHAHWWRYRHCRMAALPGRFGSHTPLYIIIAELVIGASLAPLARIALRDGSWRRAFWAGTLGGIFTIAGGLIGYGLMERILP